MLWVDGGVGVNQSSILLILSADSFAFPPIILNPSLNSPILLTFVLSRAVPTETYDKSTWSFFFTTGSNVCALITYNLYSLRR